MLARSLDSHAGGEYGPASLAAGLDALDRMMESEADENDEDVGFLFAVFERDGGLADVMEGTYPRWKQTRLAGGATDR